MSQPHRAAASAHVLVERASRSSTSRARPGGVGVFAKCRNERARLPAFLDHYRALGADGFFIVDNDSSDGTSEYLASQPDVRLFHTAGSMREAGAGVAWLNALLVEFGNDRWCITADIDELLVYPGSERSSVTTLTSYLDRHGFEALPCMLLDMYPDRALSERIYTTASELVAASPYFDSGPYSRFPVDSCPGVAIRGGMRERVFYPESRPASAPLRLYEQFRKEVALRLPQLRRIRALRRRDVAPLLTKVPLTRWNAKSRYVHNHWIQPRPVAPDWGILLHFKFIAGFHAHALREIERGEYFDGAREYRRYARMLERDGARAFMGPESTRYEGTSQLVRLGLMNETDEWRRYRETGTT